MFMSFSSTFSESLRSFVALPSMAMLCLSWQILKPFTRKLSLAYSTVAGNTCHTVSPIVTTDGFSSTCATDVPSSFL